MLSIDSVDAGYGPVRVLHGVSLDVGEGEVVAVLGANGAGKSTLMSAVAGLNPPTAGTITFDGNPIHRSGPEAIVRLGMALVPEGRRIFARLTVAENLRMGAYTRRGGDELLAELLERFPVLAERRDQPAGTLSGGEQQQLAISRALMAAPRLILLDEPSLGLAPVIVDRVFETIAGLRRDHGLTVLLVEQSIARALELADRAYVISSGRISASGTSDEIAAAASELEAAYLGGGRPVAPG